MLAGLACKIKPRGNPITTAGGSILEMQGDLSTLGGRLRHARRARHLTQAKAGEMLGMTHSALGQWETGRTTPELERLVQAADLYAASLDWLIWGGEVGSGIESRIRKIPAILRAALVERLHREIDQTEEAAKRLPPGMATDPVKDHDPRLSSWSAKSKLRSLGKGTKQ